MNNKNIEELKERKLDKCVFTLYCMPIELYFNYGENKINKRELYLFFECNLLGQRKYITNIFKDKLSSVSECYDFLQSFTNKDIEHILYAIIPDNKILSKALKLAFKEIEYLISIYEPINKIEKYLSKNQITLLESYLRKIYLSKSIDEYNMQLNNFIEYYNDFPFIKDLIEENLLKAKNYYNYPYILRKTILSLYFLRDLRRKLITIRNSKIFSSNDEFIENLLPYIQKIETRMFSSKKFWQSILSQIYKNDSIHGLIKQYL